MREVIRFLLGHEVRELRQPDPTLTVLDWLRTVERRIGTKEGCAEGDCGACTVVLGRLAGDRVRYQAVCSCIQFVPTLDGCQLLTVEDLAGPGGALHPVQQALVDTHGSQCGFCTPGFVMSLFALLKSDARPDRQTIDDALAGNLCRCTGYTPIAAAAARMYDLAASVGDRFAERELGTVETLRGLADDRTIAVGADGRRFLAPATADDLAALLLAHPDACILAGGTDVGLWVTKAQRVLDPVIHLGRIAELRRVVETADAIEIGAAATYADAAPIMTRHYPDMGELFRRLGGMQIRNLGTIGGNVANGSPIGDSPPALIACGAELVLRRGDRRRTLPLEDFFLDYGRQDRRPAEFVERILLPKPPPDSQFRAYKITKRFDQDISAVLGAFLLTIADGRVSAVRIAYGGMAATPRRARACEQVLLGRPWTRATVETGMAALGEDFTPIDDWRASAGYRATVARNLLLKLFVETTDPGARTRLVGAGSMAHA
jgi:xanthine dehydrogenase small subunit